MDPVSFNLEPTRDRDLIAELLYLRKFRLTLAEYQIENLDETLEALGSAAGGAGRDELRDVLAYKIEVLRTRIPEQTRVYPDEVQFIRDLMTA